LTLVNTSYLYDVNGVDPDLDSLEYALLDGPQGMMIHPATGLVTWEPTADQLGNHMVRVQANDGRGGVAVQEYVVCVHGDPANHSPVIISEPLTSYLLAGPNNPPLGNTDPSEITVAALTSGNISRSMSLTVPDDGSQLGTADIIFVVDESGSMAGEQAWLGQIISALDADLEAAGLVGNRYGLVGFADTARIRQSGSDRWMNGTQFAVATTTLSTSRSGNEDGYDGIQFALNNYPFRDNAARNIILVTDEERTTVNNALTFSSTTTALSNANILFSIVANALLRDESGNAAFGVASDGTAYINDGMEVS